MTKLEVGARHARLDLLDELPAHRLDAVAHRRRAPAPTACAAPASSSTVRHDLAAVGRRVGVVGADDALQLAEQRAPPRPALPATTLTARRRARRRARTTWRTSSRRTPERMPAAKRRTGARVGVDAVAEALVGDVEERHQAARLDDARAPASHWSAVRSTPVGLWQQACSTTIAPARHRVERGEHAGEVRRRAWRRRSRGRLLTVKPALSNSARWFSQLGSLIQTSASGVERAQEVGADLQAAGAAERLHGDDALFRATGGWSAPKTSCLDRACRRPAGRRSAGSCAGAAVCASCLLGAAHALEQRHLAVVVVVHADAEVHLLRVRGRR